MVCIRMMSVNDMKNTTNVILMCLLHQHVSSASARLNILTVIYARATIQYVLATFSRLLLIAIVDVRRFKLCAFS